MSCRSVSATLVLVAAAGAPWTSGAHTHAIGKGWWIGILLAAAFATLTIHYVLARKRPQLPTLAAACGFFLLGCLIWWTSRPPLDFATPFSAEHWHFIEITFPFAVLTWPEADHLSFLICTLLGFMAAMDLGTDEKFRRELTQVIGLSGVAFALYALGIKWLGWSNPPWIDLANDTEQFNVGYFHHNAPGASLNLAWPLLVFSSPPLLKKTAFVDRTAVLLITAAALPLWHSRSAPAVALGLFLAGLLAALSGTRWVRFPRALPFGIAAAFLVIGSWQAWSIVRMQSTYPDHWVSAAQTRQDAPARDAKVKALAETRRDHLVASPAPPRPAAWLAAVRMAKDYPLIGLGPGTWLKRAALYSNDTIVNTFYQHRQFVHHDLLQVAAEWGCLPAIAWVVLWIGAFRREARRVTLSPTYPTGLLLALLGIALLSTVHFPLQNPALLLWTVLLLGLAWVGKIDAPPEVNSPREPVDKTPLNIPAS